ncbi:hypothetical protein GCM10025865_07930 [Paraoerskovia sediminicola]|uniref:Uncharacterized protein n=1 Tax=Paraoerskovia sediminicola TaxID=1138587 RepID=A0ABN6X9N5_9CELL|nr:hypothetical protein GCM10025865_07930 [Paraoerskovia sediminicola]
MTGDVRHRGVGAGREDELVVRVDPARRVEHGVGVAVDREHLRAEAQVDAGVVPQRRVAERELGRVVDGEERREVDPVVGQSCLLGEDGDAPRPGVVARQERLDESLGDHAAADDQDVLRASSAHISMLSA